MTEIPEHLLARSRQARAAASGDADAGAAEADTTAETPAAAAPANEAAVPAVVGGGEVEPAETPPEPVAPYVEAARRRKRVPYWVLPVLLFLPIWAIFYVGMLEPPPAEAEGLLFEGGEVYETTGCAGCHGGGGGGGTGRQLSEGEVLLTFPSQAAGAEFDGLASQISWVVNGTAGTQALGLSVYGDPDREGGAHAPGSFGAMGNNEALSVEQVVSVVYHERVTFGGLDPEAAALELEVLEEFIAEAEEAGLEWDGQSPEEITELLDEARAAVEGGGAEG